MSDVFYDLILKGVDDTKAILIVVRDGMVVGNTTSLIFKDNTRIQERHIRFSLDLTEGEAVFYIQNLTDNDHTVFVDSDPLLSHESVPVRTDSIIKIEDYEFRAKIRINDNQGLDPSTIPSRPLNTSSWFGMDCGKTHSQQEDAIGWCLTDKTQIWIVADGVGSEKEPEVASKFAVQNIIWEVVHSHDDVDEHLLKQMYESTSDQLREYCDSQYKETDRVATTATLVILHRGYWLIVHAGDCRAYLLRSQSGLVRLTNEQTRAQKLIEDGQVEADALQDPDAHTLASGLGLKRLVVDQKLERARLNDIILICSDGLSRYIDNDSEIQDLFSNYSPEQVAKSLIQKALNSGGEDNIALFVIQASGGIEHQVPKGIHNDGKSEGQIIEGCPKEKPLLPDRRTGMRWFGH